jgi:hypothetical protein
MVPPYSMEGWLPSFDSGASPIPHSARVRSRTALEECGASRGGLRRHRGRRGSVTPPRLRDDPPQAAVAVTLRTFIRTPSRQLRRVQPRLTGNGHGPIVRCRTCPTSSETSKSTTGVSRGWTTGGGVCRESHEKIHPCPDMCPWANARPRGPTCSRHAESLDHDQQCGVRSCSLSCRSLSRRRAVRRRSRVSASKLP